jgi:hypothetical protein
MGCMAATTGAHTACQAQSWCQYWCQLGCPVFVSSISSHAACPDPGTQRYDHEFVPPRALFVVLAHDLALHSFCRSISCCTCLWRMPWLLVFADSFVPAVWAWLACHTPYMPCFCLPFSLHGLRLICPAIVVSLHQLLFMPWCMPCLLVSADCCVVAVRHVLRAAALSCHACMRPASVPFSLHGWGLTCPAFFVPLCQLLFRLWHMPGSSRWLAFSLGAWLLDDLFCTMCLGVRLGM